nr:uncharacterized protein [Candida metapsilosis]
MHFVIVSTALVSLLLQPAFSYNFSSVEQRFHQHINFLKEAFPRRKTLGLNHTISLVSISNEGVPVNFGEAHLDSKTTPSLVIENLSFNMSGGEVTAFVPSETVMTVPEVETRLSMVSEASQLMNSVSDAITVSAATAYALKHQVVPTSEFDALAEIKRLEMSLEELREQMSQRELSYMKQLEKVDQGPVAIMEKATSKVSTVPISYETYVKTVASTPKINGRQIMTGKPPSDSVMIKPQFQYHTNQKANMGLPYHKPKIAWNEVPTSTTSAASVGTDEMLGMLKEGDYTILFDKDRNVGYIDANAIQFAQIADATTVPSITQYEEYFAKQTGEYSQNKELLDDVSSGIVVVLSSSATTLTPIYDQDLIHLPPIKAMSSVDVNKLEGPSRTRSSTSRGHRMSMRSTKSFNFDVFGFETETSSNSGEHTHWSVNFLRYIVFLAFF